MEELLARLIQRTPFANLDEAKLFLAWYEDASAHSEWDDQRADWAKALVFVAESI